MLVSGSEDHSIIIRNLKNYEVIQTLILSKKYIGNLFLYINKTLLVTNSSFNLVQFKQLPNSLESKNKLIKYPQF